MKKLLNISLSSVCAASLLKAAGTLENIPLARIGGEAIGLQHGRSGQVTIMGDFRAINLETGEEFSSAVLYLPRGLQEVVLVAMDEGNNTVRFAYDIWAEPDPKGKSYTVAFADLLEDDKKPDPLASFMKSVGSKSSFDIKAK